VVDVRYYSYILEEPSAEWTLEERHHDDGFQVTYSGIC
jgi:hypothetical protein